MDTFRKGCCLLRYVKTDGSGAFGEGPPVAPGPVAPYVIPRSTVIGKGAAAFTVPVNNSPFL